MNQRDLKRISQLSKAANNPEICFDAMYLDFFRQYNRNEMLECEEARYADAYLYAFEHIKPVIDDNELIIGKPSHPLSEDERAEFEKMRPMMNNYATMYGQDSHMAVDYRLLLSMGTSGVAEKIKSLCSKTTDLKKLRFYDCCLKCLQAVEVCAKRYSAAAFKKANECSDSLRKAELIKIAEICDRVPRFPAKSFYEAVQSVSFLSYCLSFDPKRYCVSQQFQLGHIDRYLLPYYENDIATGKLTREEAQILLDCLGIQINNRVPHGLSSGYMVGGRLPDKTVVANDLTEMGMQVIDDIRLVYPSVGYCYTADSPPHLLKLACKILSHGCSHPAIFNDDLIRKGLLHYGVKDEDSYEYIHSTCVEITPVGASSIWVASPYHNMPQLLLDILDREYSNMQELLQAYFLHLDNTVMNANAQQEEFKKWRKANGMEPLLSCFVNDCLLNGLDIERGGARYSWIMPSFVGIANLVDSLTVIEQVIFKEHSMTFAELKKMLDCNFEGNERIRLRLLNGIEKYGNDINSADALFSVITKHITDFCSSYNKKTTDSLLVPSAFCWIMHEQFGKITGATPDGRLAGFPLGDGSGPCQGREHNGPTASICSSTKWDHSLLIGGVAVNIKLSKKNFTDNSIKNTEALIRTYMQRGGFEIQINVVDQKTLLAAQKNPEEYKNLVVRIGGYSDYFVSLSNEMQAEIILRTAHEI